MDMKAIEAGISDFIREEVEKANGNGVVIGFSGGIDSAVAMSLAANALGKNGVMAILMPSRNMTPVELMEAENYVKELGVRYRIIHIDPILESFNRVLMKKDDDANANLHSRIRMCILYYFANSENLLVAGAGNKSELSIGYFTKYGDGGVDILPIGGLYKTEVRELARHLEIPESILNKPPSAGLKPGQTDERDIGVDYEKMDAILRDLEIGKTPTEASLTSGSTLEQASKIREMREKNRHKRLLPPLFRLSSHGHGGVFSTVGAGACLLIGVYLAKLAFMGDLAGLQLLSIALIIAAIVAFLPV